MSTAASPESAGTWRPLSGAASVPIPVFGGVAGGGLCQNNPIEK
jgi:hypothetical protein